MPTLCHNTNDDVTVQIEFVLIIFMVESFIEDKDKVCKILCSMKMRRQLKANM